MLECTIGLSVPLSEPLSVQSLTVPSSGLLSVSLSVPLSLLSQEDKDAEDDQPEPRKPSKKKKEEEDTSDKEEVCH